MKPEQFDELRKGLEDIISILDFYKEIILHTEKEMSEDNTSSTLLNEAMEVVKSSVMKSINSKLTTIIEHLSRKEE